MKKITKAFNTILLITLVNMFPAEANSINGIWISQDRSIRMEIEQVDRGIRVRQGNRSWQDYRRRGNRFENSSGSFCRLIDGRSLEWYDRYNRRRYVLYRANDFGWPGSDARYYNHYWNRKQLGNLEGSWFNESTGQRIQIKTRRGQIRIKFRGARSIELVKGRNSKFVDEFGNIWIMQRDRIIFESMSRDLIMEFVKGDYRGGREKNHFRFK